MYWSYRPVGRRRSFGASAQCQPEGCSARERKPNGAVAQLGEHLLCKQGVSGSIPLSSTMNCPDAVAANAAALRTGRATMRDALTRCTGGVDRLKFLIFEEKTFCTAFRSLCLFCIHCEEKICLEASRCFGDLRIIEMSKPSPD